MWLASTPLLPWWQGKSGCKILGWVELARSLPCSTALAPTGSETTTLGTPWGMWSPVSDAQGVWAVLQRGSCTPIVRCAWPKGRHLFRTKTLRILIAFWLFSRVIGSKLVPVMGHLQCLHACRCPDVRNVRPGPFTPRPFPYLADCPENWPLPLLPPPLPMGWGFCLGLLLGTGGGKTQAGAGRLGWGGTRVPGPLTLTRVSNIMMLDFKETSPCSLFPAWDISSSSKI